MTKTTTFALIKPHIVQTNQIGQVLQEIEHRGFKIKQMKMITMTIHQASQLYIEHKDKEIMYSGLIDRMTAGPVVILCLEKENCMTEWRKAIGPAQPIPNTIRKMFAVSKELNAVHGADSESNVMREMSIFF